MPKFPYIVARRSTVGAHRPGVYGSPILSEGDVARKLADQHASGCLPDIDLQHDQQSRLLEDFASYYADVDFPETKQDGSRFYLQQEWFAHSDAYFLNGFLRHFQPKRIIEIGSGFSSSVMLDTIDQFSLETESITFVEPNATRLRSLLSEKDKQRVTIFESPIQSVDQKIFSELVAGDLLFVDSSHVLKYGSDLQTILFEIVPSLPVGVHVHFHDIFYPFEYPKDWIRTGRYWNECYFLRAFLSSNRDWKITLFNHYVNETFGDFIAREMPNCRKGFGGSLYIQRVAN